MLMDLCELSPSYVRSIAPYQPGKPIAELAREMGLQERTLVIFTSDNGPWLQYDDHGGSAGLLRDGKSTTWEGGLRVPAIAWWPGTVPAGVVRTQLTSNVDLFPTAIALAGGEVPRDRVIDGRNLVPLLRGESKAEVREFFPYYRTDELYAARLGPWKAHFITRSPYTGQTEAVEHATPELYNLDVDPSEKYNVAEAHPDVIAAIRRAVAEFQ